MNLLIARKMSFHNAGKIKDFGLFVTNTYHGASGSLKSLSHRNALRAFVFVLSLSMKKSERIHVFDYLICNLLVKL